jgi:subtilase family serine protease
MSVTGDSGFQCSASGGQFTCSNGSIKAAASAKITVTVKSSPSNFTNTLDVVVDPANAIYERSETNNSAWATTVVAY